MRVCEPDWLFDRLPKLERLPCEGEKVLRGCVLLLPNVRLPKLLPVADERFTVERVLLCRGVPKERVPLLPPLTELPLPIEPKERLRSGLSADVPRCRLPNVRLPLWR